MTRPTIAHATSYRRVTLIALARSLSLTEHCELCGAFTHNVAFYPKGIVVELCSACAGESGLTLGGDYR